MRSRRALIDYVAESRGQSANQLVRDMTGGRTLSSLDAPDLGVSIVPPSPLPKGAALGTDDTIELADLEPDARPPSLDSVDSGGGLKPRALYRSSSTAAYLFVEHLIRVETPELAEEDDEFIDWLDALLAVYLPNPGGGAPWWPRGNKAQLKTGESLLRITLGDDGETTFKR